MSTQKKLLLVEDDPLIALAEQHMLQRAGYAVLHVATGEQAVAAAGAQGTGIDLILMDIDLGPGIDGIEAATRILQTCDLPLVFLSSHTEREYTDRAEQITSYGYIVKHSGETVLLASIGMAFKLHEATTELRRQGDRARWWHSLMQYVVHHDPSAIAVLDGELRFLFVSDRFVRDYHVGESTIIGRHHYDVFPDIPEKWREVHRRALAGEVFSHDQDEYIRADGSVEYTRWGCRPWHQIDGSVGGIIIYTEVITERLKEQERLRRRTSSLEKLLETSEQLGKAGEPRAMLQTVAESAVAITTMDTAAVYRLDGEYIVLEAATPAVPRDFPEELRRAALEDHPHIARTLRERTVCTISDFSRGDLTSAERQAVEARHLSSITFIPLAGQEEMVGVLMVASQGAPRELDGDQMVHCRILATQAAIALENHHLHTSLRLSEEKLTAAAAMARIGYWQFDVDRRVFTFSDSFYTVYRTTAAEQGGYLMSPEMYAAKFVHPEDAHMVAEEMHHAMTAPPEERFCTLDHRVIFGDGTHGHVEVRFVIIRDAAGRTTGTHGVNQDITERKNTERILEEQRRYRDSILETTAEGFWMVGPDARIVDVNESYCRMSGYTREELTSLTISDIDALEEPRETAARVQRFMENRWEVFETQHRRKDGSHFHVEVSASRFDQADGTYFVSFFRDISERKQAEAAQAQLVQQKDVLLREVQHRIKNTINTMSSLLTLQAATVDDPATLRVVNDIRSRFTGMAILYDQLYRTDSPGETSVHEYLGTLVHRVVSLFPRGAQVTVVTDVQDFLLDSRRISALGLVVNELITNAMKYGFPEERGPGTLTVRCVLEDRNVVLSVADTGGGMPVQVCDALHAMAAEGREVDLESFGLSIIVSLVHQLNGTIAALPGEGAAVRITFPYSRDPLP